MSAVAEFRSAKLPPYPLGEISERVVRARMRGVDVIDFSQMNPDLGAPSVAVDRAIQSLLLPHHHRYASSQGMSRLREAFCQFYQDRFGVELCPESECVVTMGIKEGLGHMLLALCQAGDQVTLLTPSYPVHQAQVLLAGATTISVPLFSSWDEARASSYVFSGNSEQFFSRLEDTIEHAWPRPKVLLSSFPHNPTTTTVEGSFFQRLRTTAERFGTVLLHDFAHAESFFDSESPPSLLQSGISRAVEFYSLSKSFQMPGWRLGFAVGDSELISALKRVKSYLDFGVFQPLQLAGLAVIGKHRELLPEFREVYRGRRELLIQGLSELGWEVAPHRAGAFLWGRFPERLRSIGAGRFAGSCVDEVGVAVSPGTGFDPSAEEFVRFALGEGEVRIREGLKRLAKYGG